MAVLVGTFGCGLRSIYLHTSSHIVKWPKSCTVCTREALNDHQSTQIFQCISTRRIVFRKAVSLGLVPKGVKCNNTPSTRRTCIILACRAVYSAPCTPQTIQHTRDLVVIVSHSILVRRRRPAPCMPPKKPTAQKAEKKGGDPGKKAGGSKKAKSNQAGGSNDAEASGSSKVSCLSFPVLQILPRFKWTKLL